MPSPVKAERAQLAKYRRKRDFEATPEPTGSERIAPAPRGSRRFVVQKHRASHLHYDFRLEAGGVLKSWAVPKGPTLDADERRLAIEVEDHPLDYFDFEGVIPAGNYGAGEVIVWDWGTYEPVASEDPDKAIAKGKLKFRMHGQKLAGVFTLVKMHGHGTKGNTWLLIKSQDEAADASWDVRSHESSVKTGHTLDEIADDGKRAKRSTGKVRASSRPVDESFTRECLPRVTRPELATLVDAPFDGDEWLFELKWDGFRAITTIHTGGRVEIASRSGKDLLARFPAFQSLGTSFSDAPIIVDGEIVALDREGKSSFQLLQNWADAKFASLKFIAFDVLYAQGRDLRKEPLEKRKELLARIVRSDSRDVVYSRHVVGKGMYFFESVRARGLEGMVAKRRLSPYVERRTRDWLKVKAQLEQECVVVGYTAPRGVREGFGSLILGLYDHGRLVYCGNVGTGFDATSIRMLMKKLGPLVTPRCPFLRRPKTRTVAQWLEPKVVSQVRFTEWTNDGSMRHPVFLGLRDDKKPSQCHREIPQGTEDVA